MIGKTLAHYEITGLLGKGGMGEVYRARDTKLGRDVALKILPAEFVADAERVARFRREAGLVAKLNDPGIVTIHSIEEADGRLFFTMEVVEGQGLDSLLGSTNLSIERFLKIASRIAAALATAHDAGLVHRDLKPQNILITRDDRPKILDFGLAKGGGPVEGSREIDATEVLTGDRQLVGTVPYMSPEQIESRDVDARSDLFSLGIILHEMLTGSRPFRADSDAAMLSAILRDEAPDLSGIRTDIPQELAGLIRECLQKDARHRPSNAGELKRRLRALRSHSSGSDLKEAPEPVRPRRALPWIVGALVLSAIAVGIYLGTRGGADQAVSPIQSLAILPFESAGDEETGYLSDGLTERLINQVSRFDALKVMARSTVYRVDNADPLEAGRLLGVDAVITGRIRKLGEQLSVGVELIRVEDGTQVWGERFERSGSALIGLEQELARGIGSHLRVELTGEKERNLESQPTDNEEAWRLYLRGRQLWHTRLPDALQQADVELRQAVQLDPDFALAHAALAQLHRVSWSYYAVDVAEEDRLSRYHAERALALDPNSSEAHTAMAIVHFELDWDWDATERSYQRAIELDPNNMTARQWYGEFLCTRARFDEAIASFQEGLRIDPLSQVLQISYAWTLMASGRQDESQAAIDRVLADDPESWLARSYRTIVTLSGPDEHPRMANALDYMLAFAEVDDWSEAQIARARDLYRSGGPRALLLARAEVLASRDPGSPLTRWISSYAYARSGREAEAMALIEELFASRAPMTIWFGVEPCLRGLQHNPRFVEILEQVGAITGLPEL